MILPRLEKNSLILIADVFRISLINGLPCRDEMIRWVDTEIKRVSEVPAWLTDLSLSETTNVNELITLLDRVVGPNKQLLPARIVMGSLFRYLESGSIRSDKATQVLDWLARHTPLTTEEKYIISGLDDKLQLAKSKTFGEVDEVESEVARFLSLYSSFYLDSDDQWSNVSVAVKGPLLKLFNMIRQEQTEFIEKQRTSGWKSFWKFWK